MRSELKELLDLNNRLDKLAVSGSEAQTIRSHRGLPLADFIVTQGLSLPSFQATWCRYLEQWQTYPNLLIEAARGHGKSECISHFWPTWLIVNNSNIRGLIISYSAMQAQASLRAVSESLTHLGLKPAHPSKWTQTEIIVDRTKAGKDPTLKAAGIDTFITGSHVDFVILDDAVVAENSATEDQRSKFREWYNATLAPVMNPGARTVFTGVRWRPADFHGEIEEKYSDKEPPEGLGKGKGFKVLKYPVYYPDGSLLWPERWTEEEVRKRRESDTEGGVFFESQMMLNPRGMLGQRFKEEWITSNVYIKLPFKVRYLTAYDLATGKGKDRFAGGVAAIDDANNLYIVDYLLKDITFPDQVTTVKATFDEYPSVKVGIEATQYQVALSQQLIRETNLPIYPITPIGHKEDRITTMMPALQNGKIKFPAVVGEDGKPVIRAEWYKNFLNEYLSFPRSDVHDDMLDVLYYLWMMSMGLRRGRISGIEPHFGTGDAVNSDVPLDVRFRR